MSDPVMITVYVPDAAELPRFLAAFEEMGFRETDWCELTLKDNGALVTYGPCEPRGDS